MTIRQKMFTSERFIPVVVFAVYGITLWIISLTLMGAGHGLYVPVALYSSPLGLINIPVAFFGMLLLWPLVGVLISSHNSLSVWWGIGILIAHYVSFPIMLYAFREWNDWYNFSNQVLMSQLKVGLIVSFAVYLPGQVYAWFIIRRHFRKK